MNKITRTLAGTVFACCIAGGAHAASIQSMTIEEIGIASGGLGTSTASSGGGQFRFFGTPLVSFDSTGSTDGAILMGITQADAAFTPGFNFIPGIFMYPNTQIGAPSAMIDGGGNLVLDLSGWGANISLGIGYIPLPPDIGTLITSLSAKDAASYYYTADWSHQITANDDPSGVFIGATTIWHLEGIATATVPEPNTAWLVATFLIGFWGIRRFKQA